MLYICIPSYNEAPTVGVLLWRIRKVFQEFSREYEVLVYDDGSTDGTAETLAPYRDVMPLTVLGGSERKGYAAALDALCRAVSKRTRYPRRDAAIFLQGDFTDQPEHIPELVKRFEGGADVVVAERPAQEAPAAPVPVPVRRLSRVAPWVLKPFVRVAGVRDPFGAYRLYRIAVVRDVVRAAGSRGVVVGDVAAPSWAANVELLVNAAAFARRVEAVELAPRYDVRPRATRIRPFADAMGLFRFARTARSRRLSPSAGGTGTAPSPGARESAASDAASEPAELSAPRQTAAATAAAASAAPGAREPRAGRPPRGNGARPAEKRDARDEQAAASASGSAAVPTERRRSRRSRAERRAARPSPTAAVERDEAEREVVNAPEEHTRPDVIEIQQAEAGAEGDAATATAVPDAAAADAAAEARRQRQRARRKRSRQRRAAAARDGSPDQSSSSEATTPPDAVSSAAQGDVAPPSRDANAPASPAERAPRAEAGRDAESASTSPAASNVVP